MPFDYKLKILERLKYKKVSIFYVERAKRFVSESNLFHSAIRQSTSYEPVNSSSDECF